MPCDQASEVPLPSITAPRPPETLRQKLGRAQALLNRAINEHQRHEALSHCILRGLLDAEDILRSSKTDGLVTTPRALAETLSESLDEDPNLADLARCLNECMEVAHA